MKIVNKLVDTLAVDNSTVTLFKQLKENGIECASSFVIENNVYDSYKNIDDINEDYVLQIISMIKQLEIETSSKFGMGPKPLLLKLSSGYDLIDNVGLNDQVVFSDSLNIIGIYNAYFEYIATFAEWVFNISPEVFSSEIELFLKNRNVNSVSSLSKTQMIDLLEVVKQVYFTKTGADFPQNVGVQIIDVVKAFYKRSVQDKCEIIVIETMIDETQAVNIVSNVNDDKLENVVLKITKIFKKPVILDYFIQRGYIKISNISYGNVELSDKLEWLMSLQTKNTISLEDSLFGLENKEYAKLANAYVKSGKALGRFNGYGLGLLTCELIYLATDVATKPYMYVVDNEFYDQFLVDHCSVVLTTSKINVVTSNPVIICDELVVDIHSKRVLLDDFIDFNDKVIVDFSSNTIYADDAVVVELDDTAKEMFREQFTNMSAMNVINAYNNTDVLGNTYYMNLNSAFNKTLKERLTAYIISHRFKDNSETLMLLADDIYSYVLQKFINTDYKTFYVELFDFDILKLFPQSKMELEKLCQNYNIDAELAREYILDFRAQCDNKPVSGSRLGIYLPQLYQVAYEAILKAQFQLREYSNEASLTLVLPDVILVNEIKYFKELFKRINKLVLKDFDKVTHLNLAVKISHSRLLLCSDQFANLVDEIIYDFEAITFDMYCMNHDMKYLIDAYTAKNIVADDFLVKMDRVSVGKSIAISNQFIKQVNMNIKTGIVLTADSDVDAINYAHNSGLDFVVTPKYDETLCASARINRGEK